MKHRANWTAMRSARPRPPTLMKGETANYHGFWCLDQNNSEGWNAALLGSMRLRHFFSTSWRCWQNDRLHFFVWFFRLSSLVVRAWNLESINGRTRCAREERPSRASVARIVLSRIFLPSACYAGYWLSEKPNILQDLPPLWNNPDSSIGSKNNPRNPFRKFLAAFPKWRWQQKCNS